jgi:hypothetical protein
MSDPRGNYYAPGRGPLPGEPGYGERYQPPPDPYSSWSSAGEPPAPPVSGVTVITAAVIQIVQSAFYILLGVILVFFANVVDSAGTATSRRTGTDVTVTTDAISHLLAGVGLLVILLALFMIATAALAIRGRRWAAITSTVIQGIGVLFTVVGLSREDTVRAPAATVVAMLVGLGVAILFVLPASMDYYASKITPFH